MPERPEKVSGLRAAADEDVRRLRQLLRLKISEARWTQRAVSERMGLPWHYVGQLLAGGLDLRFYQALEILLVLGLEAGAFFAELHGGEEGDEQTAVEALSSWLTQSRPGGGRGDRESAEAAAPAPEEAREARTLRERSLEGSKRSAELLRTKARGLGRTLPEMGLAVGLNPAYLGQLLRGAEPIKAKQVYGVLRALAIPPRAFFAELYPRSNAADSVVILLRKGRIVAAETSELEAWIEGVVLRVLRENGILTPD